MNILNKEVIKHWGQLRQMTYDFLNLISDQDMEKKLPFDRSQTLGFQFHCIAGTHESFLDYIKTGAWEKWSCSIDNHINPKKEEVKSALKNADNKLIQLIQDEDLLKYSNGSTALMRYMVLAEHESHHQGQIINFIYAKDLPLPKSWKDKWALEK